MEAMLKVIAETKEVEKAEVDEVTEKQKTDAEPKWCLHVMEADAAKMESLTEEAASCHRGITTLDATAVVDLEFEVAISVTR